MSINATLIGQMITFTLLVWFTMKYVWPPIMQALDERKKKIAEGLAAAERGHHEMELAEKRTTVAIKEAREQAAEIVGKAQKRAGEIVEESKESARTEGERLIAAARSEISREVQQAKESLRDQVSVLAVDAAEQILREEVDRKKHEEILNTVSQQLDKA